MMKNGFYFILKDLFVLKIFDNSKYNQKLPHIYIVTKWMANNHFFVVKSKYSTFIY